MIKPDVQSIIPLRFLALGGVGVLGAIGAIMYFLPGLGSSAWLTLAAGGLVVSIVVFFVLLLLRWRMRRAYGQGDLSLMEMVRGRPASVSDPEQVARLDDFSRKFEEGCKKYVEATGLSVSESPWYLLVGESGSGKTEAIRRCGVEFPEGLQEERQGAGGTTNMDWWFTEQAIILDTAGRFAIDPLGRRAGAAPDISSADPEEDVEESAANDREHRARQSTELEWEMFLQRVVKARPHCPVNGLVLVIPATSLLRDSATQINAKGEELARHLGGVRQSLGVRFPVFVLVTKSDLIPGFREFFSHITDPELSQQMLGWSKAGSLDEPFDPDEIDEYLAQIRRRLERRRLSLILDPVHSQLPGARRIEQVDALYTFPQRFTELGPQLRRYLGKMFIRSKFNQSPLFLRGIYFTSSMEQGAAIDSVLANLRGVTLKQLERQGFGYRRERAVFLRDVFMQKVFGESGLVTRETQTDHIRRKRQIRTMVTASAATLLLMFFAWLGWQTIEKHVASANADWEPVSKNYDPNRWNLIKPRNKNDVLSPAKIQWDQPSGADGDSTIAAFIAKESSDQSHIKTPFIYAPLLLLEQSPEGARTETRDTLIEHHLSNNVVDTANQRITAVNSMIDSNQIDQLDDAPFQKNGAITQAAIEMQTIANLTTKPDLKALMSLDLNGVFDAAIQPLGKDNKVPQGGKILDGARTMLNSSVHGSDMVEHLRSLHIQRADADGAALAVANFWSHRLDKSAAEQKLAALKPFREALGKWEAIFKSIVDDLQFDPNEPVADFLNRAHRVSERVKDLKEVAGAADFSWAKLCDQAHEHDVQPILVWLSGQLVNDQHAALEALGQLSSQDSGVQQKLSNAMNGIRSQTFDVDSLIKSGGLTGFDSHVRSVTIKGNSTSVGAVPNYRATTDLLASAAAPLETTSTDASGAAGSLGAQLDAIDANGAGVKRTLERLEWTTASDNAVAPRTVFGATHPAETLYVTLSAPASRYHLVNDWITRAPKTVDQFAQRVQSESAQQPVKPVIVPLAADAPAEVGGVLKGWELADSYNPASAAGILADTVAVRELLAPAAASKPATQPAQERTMPNRAEFAKSAAAIQKSAGAYTQKYIAFWFDRRPAAGLWPTWTGESGLYAALQNTSSEKVGAAIDARIKQVSDALGNIAPFVQGADKTALDARLNALPTLSGTPEISAAFDKWMQLPSSALGAATALTGGATAEQNKTYLLAVNGQHDLYYHQLFLAALHVLATDAQKVSVAQYKKFNDTILNKFPFNTHLSGPQDLAPTPLNIKELANAAKQLTDAFGPDITPAAPVAAADTDASVIQDPELRDAYIALRQASSGAPRLLAARNLAVVLTDPKVTCEITVLKAPELIKSIYFGQNLENMPNNVHPPPPEFIPIALAPKTPFTVRPGSGKVFFLYKWGPQGRSVRAGIKQPNPCETLRLLAMADDFRSPKANSLWPGAGRAIDIKVRDENSNRLDEIAILTINVIFKRNDNPIDVQFPIPDN